MHSILDSRSIFRHDPMGSNFIIKKPLPKAISVKIRRKGMRKKRNPYVIPSLAKNPVFFQA